MENASKALIIAGAILLAILLISLGLIVFRNASGTMQGKSVASGIYMIATATQKGESGIVSKIAIIR